MQVAAGGIPAIHLSLHSLVADHRAVLFGKVGVPSGSDQRAAAVEVATHTQAQTTVLLQACRAIGGGRLGQTDGGQRHRALVACVNQRGHILDAQLIQQVIPCGVIIGAAAQRDSDHFIFGTGGGHSIVGRIVVRRVGAQILDDLIGCSQILRRGCFREGGAEIRTGHVGCCAVVCSGVCIFNKVFILFAEAVSGCLYRFCLLGLGAQIDQLTGLCFNFALAGIILPIDLSFCNGVVVGAVVAIQFMTVFAQG